MYQFLRTNSDPSMEEKLENYTPSCENIVDQAIMIDLKF